MSFKIQYTHFCNHLLADTWETAFGKTRKLDTLSYNSKSRKFINRMYSFDVSTINDSDISLDLIYKVTLKN